MKKCTKCLIEKDYSEFSPKTKGLASRCKSCAALYRREKYNKQLKPEKCKFKICSMCDQLKSIQEFYKQSNCATHRSECKKCSTVRRSLFKNRIRLFLIELKQKPCMDCNQKYPYYVMDFDHRDSNSKICNISQMRFSSKEKLLKEISKCDLICANCHRIRTFKRQLKKEISHEYTQNYSTTDNSN